MEDDVGDVVVRRRLAVHDHELGAAIACDLREIGGGEHDQRRADDEEDVGGGGVGERCLGLALMRRPRERALWRTVAQLASGDALSDVRAFVTPLLRGERVLAVVPFVLRFVADGADVTRSEAARALATFTSAVGLAGVGGDASHGEQLAPPASSRRGMLSSVVGSVREWRAAIFDPPIVF